MKKIDNKDIKKILSKCFSKSKIPKKLDNLKYGDLKEWDSIGNFNLLLEFEEFYNIKFSLEEMSNFKSIKDIKNYLKKLK
tara:strand:+ start:551 stop:790 length:240 start_codon:yes stop_codon:yes gene_type:complete